MRTINNSTGHLSSPIDIDCQCRWGPSLDSRARLVKLIIHVLSSCARQKTLEVCRWPSHAKKSLNTDANN